MIINVHHIPEVTSKIVLFSPTNNSKKDVQFRAEIISQLIDRKSMVSSCDD